MLSVVGGVPVDSGAPVVTSSISRICRLSLSEVLIEVGLCACIYRDDCACVCTAFLKKKSKNTWCERACSLVVTRASIAPKVLSSTPRGSEFSRI